MFLIYIYTHHIKNKSEMQPARARKSHSRYSVLQQDNNTACQNSYSKKPLRLEKGRNNQVSSLLKFMFCDQSIRTQRDPFRAHLSLLPVPLIPRLICEVPQMARWGEGSAGGVLGCKEAGNHHVKPLFFIRNKCFDSMLSVSELPTLTCSLIKKRYLITKLV